MNPGLRIVLRIFGIGVLVAGGFVAAVAALAAVILLGPFVFWIAWNVLDFAHAVGLPELGFSGGSCSRRSSSSSAGSRRS